jgi:hypothetical protein
MRLPCHNWALTYQQIYSSAQQLKNFSTCAVPGSKVMTVDQYATFKKNQ